MSGFEKTGILDSGGSLAGDDRQQFLVRLVENGRIRDRLDGDNTQRLFHNDNRHT